ncbi:AAA family ATPase [Ruegeria conchae]|uniref:AAA family ATPase n=1 Tax=Ruegeria conchae TaxID=981384 RepID=UPI0029C6F8AC|nr:AAA family ATPase [Ruegeria conchae]
MTDQNAEMPPKPSGRKIFDNRGIELVLLEKTDGLPFTKTIRRENAGGEWQSEQAPPALAKITAKRVKLSGTNTLRDLTRIIKGLTKFQALSMGRLPAGVPDGVAVPVVLDGMKGKGDHGRDYVHRTAEDFAYEAGVPVLQPFDFDVKSYPKHIRDKVEALGGPWAAVCHAVPELKDVEVMRRPSTSTGIIDTRDGATYPGGGEHAYVVLSDGRDAEHFMKTVRDRLWEAGLGYARVVGGGRVLKWSIIDHTIWMPQQPIYEAPPTLEPAEQLKQTGRMGQIEQGTVNVFDAKRDLKPADEVRAAQLFDATKASPEVQAEIRRRKGEWVAERAQCRGVSVQQAQASLAFIMEYHKLDLEEQLVPLHDKILGTPTVLDVLEDLDRWDKVPIADPIEGPGYGRQTAKIYKNAVGGRPKVNSKAHGGILYDMNDYTAEDIARAVQGGLDLDRVVRVLGVPHGVVTEALALLDGRGVCVDARSKEQALRRSQVETIARAAQAVVEFGEYPLPGFDAPAPAHLDGLRKIASKQKPEGAPFSVGEWLGTQKTKLAEVEAKAAGADLSSADTGAYGPLGVQSLSDFIDSTQPRKSIVKPLGWYRQTVNTVTANPNGGKTAIALEVAFALALGEVFQGRQLEPMPVLYFAGENFSDVRARVVLMCLERGIDPKNVPIDIRKGGFSFADHAKKVLFYTRQKEYGLIVVDTLAAHFGGDSENDNTQMQRYFDSFGKIANGPGIPAVVVLAHPSAEGAKLEPQRRLMEMRPRGASSSLGAIDSNLNVAVLPGGIVQAHLHKRRSKPVPDVYFRLKPLRDPSVVDGDGDLEESVRAEPITQAQAQFAADDLGTRILKEIQKDAAVSVRGLTDAIAADGQNVAHGTVQNKLEDLREHGLIDVSGENRNVRRSLTQAGQARLDEADEF